MIYVAESKEEEEEEEEEECKNRGQGNKVG